LNSSEQMLNQRKLPPVTRTMVLSTPASLPSYNSSVILKNYDG